MKIDLGLCGLLTVCFLALRVAGIVDWSLWWVFSPLWLPFAVLGAAAGILALVCFIQHTFFDE